MIDISRLSPEFGLIHKVISVMTNRCILEQFPDIADKLRHTAHSMTAFEAGLLRSPGMPPPTTASLPRLPHGSISKRRSRWVSVLFICQRAHLFLAIATSDHEAIHHTLNPRPAFHDCQCSEVLYWISRGGHNGAKGSEHRSSSRPSRMLPPSYS
jgi:hypothetical protein